MSTTPAANFATSSPFVVDTGDKFATGVNNTGGKFAPGVNDDQWQIATSINNTGGKFATVSLHRWQIMGTISGCRHLKVNLKAKIYIYVSSTTQR
jgi:hypothetical protein